MLIKDTNQSVKLLESINFIDSSLFGFSVDIFKIQLLIDAELSSSLKDIGLNENFEELQFDFRLIRNLQLKLDKPIFGPPYDADGELMTLSLGNFTFESLNIIKEGITGTTQRDGVYSDGKPIYAVDIEFYYGRIKFQFSELEISLFDPRPLDTSG